MKFTSLPPFKKAFQEELPSVCFVIGKEIGEALDLFPSSTAQFDAESFTGEAFGQEVETLPFLSKEVIVHVKEVDKLKKEAIERLTAYVKRPNAWVKLFLSASTFHPQSKLLKAVEEAGLLLRLAEPKAWEKEKNLADWLMHEAARSGTPLPLPAAQALVKAIGFDREFLRQELEKLILYVGEKREITVADMRAISSVLPHDTLWELGDAIFGLQAPRALQVGRHLIDAGTSLFPVLAALRTQVNTAIEILSLHHQGGEMAVREKFPYLKGSFLQKKLTLLQTYGLSRLREALVILYKAEIDAKNSQTAPDFQLELLITRLAYAPRFAS